ncbi:MAG: hypothetical protein A2Y03_05730 [Omnitrophica WOR_2 bacterium GWF2_38_59]|nr:MAG: hypothetical protein A2Y03_05730 [Omnitrophica WOR_2 bacterium GWF2_38_59]OGX51018.1 MAG: hypothetical protein A2243_04890 [Omnitrophica WOR_2 bacterium RIFOXYA2_FULL_38_17]OGX54308.1 MAG: hypothetical protein A2267_02950 [Omnitrophica WOR_2 bacterium RIFOXYA12_FULL_38_10]OGX56442.1 MAG: hypothetical protein A2306_11495 [Omnitrophica WOR_2 bacterium RIFOXYB2_FULL_38_16]HBG61577.1 hypothetical protein [Candidatus Omnitrophota bacterium]
MINEIVPILSLLGLGGIAGAFFNSIWERNKTISLQKQQYKETRYKAIILLMYGFLEYKDESDFLIIHRPDLNSKEKLFLELKTEWNNMILYASDEVLLRAHTFLNKPSHENYKKLAIEMRKDLWGGKISHEIEKLNFENIIADERT